MKPIISIWINTKKTFQFLETKDNESNSLMITLMFFLSGMLAGFPNSFDMYLLIGGNYYLSLFVTLIVFGLVGLAFYNYLFSFVFLGVCRIFKGKAPIDQIRLVYAYSLIPNLIVLLISILMIIPAVVLDDKSLIGYSHPIANIVLWIVTLKIMVIGLAYFNKFSYLFAALTVLIPVGVFWGIVYVLKYVLI